MWLGGPGGSGNDRGGRHPFLRRPSNPPDNPPPSAQSPPDMPPPKPWVPQDCQIAPDAKLVSLGPNLFPSRIVCDRHGSNVPFVLVPKHGSDDPSTFYIMENKVSNGLYEKFLESTSGSVNGSTWKSAPAPPGRMARASTNCPRCILVAMMPVSSPTGWGGGSHNGRVGQSRRPLGRAKESGAIPGIMECAGTRRIAVGRKGQGPMAVGAAKDDVSVFGCHDMAGNGEEWTCTSKDAAITLPLKTRDESVGVLLRGQSYAADKPLSFSDLENPDFGTEFYYTDRLDIGFRVVFDQCPP